MLKFVGGSFCFVLTGFAEDVGDANLNFIFRKNMFNVPRRLLFFFRSLGLPRSMMSMQSETLFSYRYDQYSGPITCAKTICQLRWVRVGLRERLAAHRHNHVERSS